jgi:hypothetical protein
MADQTPNIAESLSTQSLSQKLDLTIRIAFKQGPSIRIKMTARKHMQLLRLTGFPISLQSDIGRAEHVVIRYDHQQGCWRDAVHHV